MARSGFASCGIRFSMCTNTGSKTFLVVCPVYMPKAETEAQYRESVERPVMDGVASRMDITALNTILRQTGLRPTTVPMQTFVVPLSNV